MICLNFGKIVNLVYSLNDNYYIYLFQTDYSSFLKNVQKAIFYFLYIFSKNSFTRIYLSLTGNLPVYLLVI